MLEAMTAQTRLISEHYVYILNMMNYVKDIFSLSFSYVLAMFIHCEVPLFLMTVYVMIQK